MKPNLLRLFVYALVALSAMNSCRAIIEPNINSKTVRLETPGANFQSTSYSINFWWDEVDDALTYRLQVVSPAFDAAGSLALDTVIKTNRFAVTLSPGSYQWRVRAENGSSKTAYSSPGNFQIVLSSIKAQKAQLMAPVNNSLTNVGQATFSWGGLYGATKYRLQIDTNNFINENAVIYNQVIPGQQINFMFPKDQIFQWRVRAENDTAQALWSSVNTITYDHTPPVKVTLASPVNNKTIALPVALQWNSAPTAVKYKLYVFKSDSATVYNQTFPLVATATNYNFNFGSINERIYWKVSAIDAAGNEGPLSEMRSFILQ